MRVLRRKRQQLLQAAPEIKPTQPITDASFDGGEYCAKVILKKKCWQSVFFLSTSFKVLQSVKTTSNTVTAGDRWTMHLPISPRPHPCFHIPALFASCLADQASQFASPSAEDPLQTKWISCSLPTGWASKQSDRCQHTAVRDRRQPRTSASNPSW